MSSCTKSSIYAVDGQVAAYLYGPLDSDIYMNVLDKISISNQNTSHNMHCIKIQKSLSGLKSQE